MSAIPFTDRELKRAWRELNKVATPSGDRENPHRLLLFYAVECGLKAVLLKRESRSLFDQTDIDKTGHDLRGILKSLAIGGVFLLPNSIQLEPAKVHGKEIPRAGNIGILHQAWRYGGSCKSINDKDCEKILMDILTWINKELR